jgi:hypothetical protein
VLKKTITYEDFNGETVSEDFFFHLSKAELVELEMSHTGGLSATLERIIAAQDNKALIKEFKNLILSSYGKRSDDGRRFIKNQELRDEFESSEAYSTLFMELVTDTDAAIDFVQGMIPANLEEDAKKLQAANTNTPAPVVPITETEPEVEVVTRVEIAKMSEEELSTFGKRLAKGEVRIQGE